jgi:hypothetical protein
MLLFTTPFAGLLLMMGYQSRQLYFQGDLSPSLLAEA